MRQRKRGFTLLEVVITVALVSVTALLMFTFFGQGFNLYTKESDSADEQMNLRNVVSDITNKVRLTEPDNITCESGVLTVDTDTYALLGDEIIRNDTAIANGIAAFNVSIQSDILSIEVVNTSGTGIATSLSLVT